MTRTNNKTKRGVALISVLAITAVILVVMTVGVVVAMINSQVNFHQAQNQKTLMATDSVLQEAVLRYLRDRNFSNPYPDWTQNCLQVQNFTCKMELNLTVNGGTINAWGKVNDKLRHLQVQLTVNADQEVSVSGQREIY